MLWIFLGILLFHVIDAVAHLVSGEPEAQHFDLPNRPVTHQDFERYYEWRQSQWKEPWLIETPIEIRLTEHQSHTPS